MKTRADYINAEIKAGRFRVGAVVTGTQSTRTWIPMPELSRHIDSVVKRVDRLMNQQLHVDYVTCISGDLQQLAVLYVLPQQGDGLSMEAARGKDQNLLGGLMRLVDAELLGTARSITDFLNEFKSGRMPDIEEVRSVIDQTPNPMLGEQLIRQCSCPLVEMETSKGSFQIGGFAGHVPESLFAEAKATVEFVPTRGIDERDSKVRGEIERWTNLPEWLTPPADASFSIETGDNMRVIKALEFAQLHHKTVRAEVTVAERLRTGRPVLGISKLLNLEELAAASDSVQKLLFGA